ncbi:unnamed protein product (macronuclear) [Paramecium tetraurelia]|uniref:Uncharacterized protein n=1 Tax=Paramecium tetraurelia TaxID=5888 RepID=A0EAJ8_PARTE|nr:uncharacterized protein GSPATT00025049001 [Paramecium tetraurelia]CAK92315.1 unnamed protein product [Paramecium tetraurelia]|eukprot:XP_001459712.1 hypothetical protein (macronuclear) [Paramecium tetraurelia strain d4-2]
MDFEHSDQFTQRVELIIRNFLHIPDEGEHNWKEINQKLDYLQSQLVDVKLSILQYLKQSFEAIREQLQCDLEAIQIEFQSKNLQQIPLVKTGEMMVNERIDQIGLNVQEIEKSLVNKIDQLSNKVGTIKMNRDELQEQIKSFDGIDIKLKEARMESQWQGLANVSDQFWLFKKQFEPLLSGTQQQKKKHSLFT